APAALIIVRWASGVTMSVTLLVWWTSSRCTRRRSTPACFMLRSARSANGPVPTRVAMRTSLPSRASTVATVPPEPPGSSTARTALTSPPGSGNSLTKYIWSTVASPITRNLGIYAPLLGPPCGMRGQRTGPPAAEPGAFGCRPILIPADACSVTAGNRTEGPEQGVELLQAQALGADARVEPGAGDRGLDGLLPVAGHEEVALERLAAVGEGGGDEREQVGPRLGNGVDLDRHDGAPHLRGGHEGARRHGAHDAGPAEVGHEQGEGPERLGPRPGGEALAALELHEAGEPGEAPRVERAGDHGRGQVVGQVGGQHRPGRQRTQVERQRVSVDDLDVVQARERLGQHRQEPGVHLDRHDAPGGAGQLAREGAQAGADLEDRLAALEPGRLHHGAQHRRVDEEVLSERPVRGEPVALQQVADDGAVGEWLVYAARRSLGAAQLRCRGRR